MSNVFAGQTETITYFQLPHRLVEAKHLAECSGSGLKLYVCLCHVAHRHNAVKIEISNDEIKDRTGLSPKSIEKSRNELAERGFIRTRRGRGGVYTYSVLNPDTGQPLAPASGRKGLRVYPGKAPEVDTQQSGKQERETVAIAPSTQSTDKSWRCFSCLGTEFWLRDGGPVCARCHPRPDGSASVSESSDDSPAIPWDQVGSKQ